VSELTLPCKIVDAPQQVHEVGDGEWVECSEGSPFVFAQAFSTLDCRGGSPFIIANDKSMVCVYGGTPIISAKRGAYVSIRGGRVRIRVKAGARVVWLGRSAPKGTLKLQPGVTYIVEHGSVEAADEPLAVNVAKGEAMESTHARTVD